MLPSTAQFSYVYFITDSNVLSVYVFNDKCIGAVGMSVRAESLFGTISTVQECATNEREEG